MYIAREKHDAMVAELAASKKELETMKTDMEAADAETSRLESENKELAEKVKALEAENTQLKADNEKLTAEVATLKAENADLKKLPGAETATTTKDKEQRAADDKSVNLATSDDKSFEENLASVKERYL
jgi:chromosome segregation ATPase